jgi:hypothetical protein
MLFSFVGVDSIYPGAVLDYVPRGWVGESCMVRVDHLFVLQVYASSFGTSQQEKNGMLFFSMRWSIGRLSTG